MTYADFQAISPLLINGYMAVVVMVVIAFKQSQKLAFWLTLIGLAAAFASVFYAAQVAPRVVTPLLREDGYALYFTGLILASSILCVLLCPRYMANHEKRSEGFYPLVLFAVLGMLALVSSSHFVSFFLGLETLSISLFGLLGYTREHKPSLESAIKYLILAATASAFLLFGIALVYSESGSMSFPALARYFTSANPSSIAYLGIVMVLVAFGFKLALSPFHMWSPDVYEGSPAPATAILATGSKCATFALLLRMISQMGLGSKPGIFWTLVILAVATMFTGNLLALLQTNVKRILAYSSIAHMGYLLIPLLAGFPSGPSSIVFYLTSYIATTIAAFGVITILSATRQSGDIQELEDYRGLSRRNPMMAVSMTIALLSLTGIPLTAGFFAKLYIFTAAIQKGLWALLIIGLINSGISAYYYLRVIIVMYSPIDDSVQQYPRPDTVSALAVLVSIAAIIFFGVFPGPLLKLIESIINSVTG